MLRKSDPQRGQSGFFWKSLIPGSDGTSALKFTRKINCRCSESGVHDVISESAPQCVYLCMSPNLHNIDRYFVDSLLNRNKVICTEITMIVTETREAKDTWIKQTNNKKKLILIPNPVTCRGNYTMYKSRVLLKSSQIRNSGKEWFQRRIWVSRVPWPYQQLTS